MSIEAELSLQVSDELESQTGVLELPLATCEQIRHDGRRLPCC